MLKSPDSSNSDIIFLKSIQVPHKHQHEWDGGIYSFFNNYLLNKCHIQNTISWEFIINLQETRYILKVGENNFIMVSKHLWYRHTCNYVTIYNLGTLSTHIISFNPPLFSRLTNWYSKQLRNLLKLPELVNDRPKTKIVSQF